MSRSFLLGEYRVNGPSSHNPKLFVSMFEIIHELMNHPSIFGWKVMSLAVKVSKQFFEAFFWCHQVTMDVPWEA